MTFDEFLSESFERLAVYSRLITRDRHEADDLLADSLVVAQQRWAKISAAGHPMAYVRKIIFNRHLQRRRTWFARNVDFRPPESLPERPTRDDTAVIDTRAALAVQLDRLPARQRAAVILRYYLDLSFDEIGAEIGVSGGAARTLVSRAVAALRQTVLVEDHLQEMP